MAATEQERTAAVAEASPPAESLGAAPAGSDGEAPATEPDSVSPHNGESGELTPEPESGATPAPPQAMVVMCPHCQASFPLTHDTEGYVPNASERFSTCAECDGLGEVSTGSRLREHAVTECRGCNGTGFVDNSTGLPVTSPAGAEPPWVGATWDAERQLWV